MFDNETPHFDPDQPAFLQAPLLPAPNYQEVPARIFDDVSPPNKMNFESFGQAAPEIALPYSKLYQWLLLPYIYDNFQDSEISGKKYTGHQLRSVRRAHVINHQNPDPREKQLLDRAMKENKLTTASFTWCDGYLQMLKSTLEESDEISPFAADAVKKILAARDIILTLKVTKDILPRVELLYALEDKIREILLALKRFAPS